MDEWYRKLRARFRYGLATQESLDRLARAGLTLYPYLVMEEATRDLSAAHEPRPEVSVDEIHAAAGVLEQVGAPHMSPGKAADRFARGHRCFAVWERATPAGFVWYRFDHCIGIVHNAPLFALAAGEAHVYDMYVAAAFRGRELAVALRRDVCSRLECEGVHSVYGMHMYFARSGKRMYEKLGAVERETRLLLGIGRRYRDFRLRSRGEPLPIPRVLEPTRLPAPREGATPSMRQPGG